MNSQDDMIASTEMHLRERPSRGPDHQAENRALSRLAREMAARPDNVLHVLCDEVLNVCGAESAGVSILKGEDGQGDFLWPAVAGAWARYTGGGMPRDASPCGVVIDRNASLLFHEVERSFPAVAHASPRIREILLAPFCVGGRPIGTVWAIMHSSGKQFDREDRRLLESIAGFAAAAYQLHGEAERRAEDERRRDALTAELRERERFMANVLAASTDCIKVVELDGALSFMSEGGLRAMEISDFNDVKGCPWPDFLKDDGPALAREAIEAARQGRTTHFEAPTETMGGDLRHWSVSVSPIAGPDGAVARVLSVSRDHTELHQSQEEQRLLNAELAHRIKNLMSVVQAIAFQTLSKSADRQAVQAFEGRMMALSRSHDMLTGRGWSSAELGRLIRSAVATFGEDRFELAGPEVAIGSRAALALSLMLHELATNAVKYGALSVPEGKVRVDWAVLEEEGKPVLDFRWVERGGPPAVEPARRGFGSRVIRMGLSGSGGVNLDYGNQGLTVEARAPLYQVQEA